VLTLYPTGKIVMILDNARIHHAILLEEFLQENMERLQLVFLPPYSPKLNLIEGLWGWLKNEVINNVFHHSVRSIRRAVQGFISSIIKVPETVIRRLCLRM
jgi:putative transposase